MSLWLWLSVAIGLALVAGWVMWSVPRRASAELAEETPTRRLELELEHRKVLAQIIGGAVLVVGLVFTLNSAELARKNLELALTAQKTERFARAIDQLGAKEEAVRAGAVVTLARLAAESPEDGYEIRRLLAAYVRTRAAVPKAEPQISRSSEPSPGPPAAPMWLRFSASYSKRDQVPISDFRPEISVQLAMEAISKGRSPRVKGPAAAIDLRDADLRGADLRGLNLSHVNFENADLTAAALSGANLQGAILRGAYLIEADLSGAMLQNADLGDVIGEAAVLADADFTDAVLIGAYFPDTAAKGARFIRTTFRGGDFRRADLRDAVFRDTDMALVQLQESNLGGTRFEHVNLARTPISNEDLLNSCVSENTILSFPPSGIPLCD